MNTKTLPIRYWLAFIAIAVLLGSAQYLELYKGIIPCPLCILQRIVFALLGLFFMLGMPFSSKTWGRLSIGIICALFSGLGIALATRQVWLQHYATNQPANCEVGLQYMFQVLPFKEVIMKMLQGGAECSHVGWTLFYLSLAEWSVICFIFFFLFSIFQMRRA
jgi:disulfide bond formation protein DsbB